MGLAGAILSIALLYLWEGREMAVDELPFVITGICGAFGAVFLLFLFNLWQAPARIERDKHHKTKAELEQMRGGQMTCTFLPQPREHLSDDHRYGFSTESQLLYFASLANKTGKHLSNVEIWVSHKRKWVNTPDEFNSGSRAVKMGELGPFAVEEERQVALLGLLRKTIFGIKASATGTGLFFPTNGTHSVFSVTSPTEIRFTFIANGTEYGEAFVTFQDGQTLFRQWDHGDKVHNFMPSNMWLRNIDDDTQALLAELEGMNRDSAT